MEFCKVREFLILSHNNAEDLGIYTPGSVLFGTLCLVSIIFCTKKVFDLLWVLGVRIMNNVDTADTTGWLGLVESETEATSKKKRQIDWQRQVSISVTALAFSKLPPFHNCGFDTKNSPPVFPQQGPIFWNLNSGRGISGASVNLWY